MHILEYLFPRQCLICSRVGFDICDKCFTTIKHTLPECFVCNKLSNGYRCHKKCFNISVQCLTGWYLTKSLRLNLDKQKSLQIYSSYIYLLNKLVSGIQLDNYKIYPLSSTRNQRINDYLASFLRNKIGKNNQKNVLIIGEYIDDINSFKKQITEFSLKEPGDVKAILLFKNS